jgi:hypothetical protein
MNTATESLLWNAKRAAAALGISPRLLWTMTNTGEIPCIRIARRVLYSPDSLRAWRDAREAVSSK